MKRIGHFLLGLLMGLALPVGFICLYLYNFYPDEPIKEVIAFYPGALLMKLLTLSIIPDLVLAFVFYKLDKFKIGAGVIAGMLPFLIASFFMF